MLITHISQNKHEFNMRRVEELNIQILNKEKELRNSEGFLAKFKLRNEIKKLYKSLNNHGNEVLEFEYRQLNSLYN